MQITTLVFFALLAFFIWRGYQKGFIGSITRILSWIVAYPAALIFTPPVAKLLMQHTALTGVIVYFVAGAGIFLVVSFAVSILITTCGKFVPDNQITNNSSKIAGAGVGAFVGALTGLVVVYVLGLVLTPKSNTLNENPIVEQSAEAVNIATTSNTPSAVPALRDLQSANDSFIESSAKKLMGAAASVAVDLVLEDKTTSQVTKAFVQDPQTMLGHVQQMTNSGQMQTLIANENIQSLLTTGDTHALTRNPEFKALIDNPSMQALMAQSDVNSDAGAQAAAEKMVFAWNRVQMIKHDPRVIAIINDPEFQQQLNSANKLPLMMNPKLNQLTQIILSQDSLAANGMGNYEVVDINKNRSNRETTDDKTPTQIYRWTDDNGQVHFSDKPVNPQEKP
jgi:uncharacterized membrane protein required for colicin V production